MAQFINQSRPFLQKYRGAVIGVVSVVNLMLQMSVYAQDLADPTRPPASILQTGSGVQLPADPVLQSVLIAPDRKLAIIDGQTIKLNAKFGNQTLVKITETSVVLKRGKKMQTLNLHPDFSKKLSQSTKPSK